MSETNLQKRTIKKLRKHVGGWWTKVHGGPFQRRGLPDIFGSVNGLFIAIELKMPGNKPTELQEEAMKKIREDGGALCFWSQDSDEVVRKVKEYVEGRGENETKNSKRNRS